MTILFLTSALAFLSSTFIRLIFEMLLLEHIPVVGSFVGLALVRNAGVAFGITFPSAFQFLLVGLALLLVLLLAYRSRHSSPQSIGFGLIIGGALANIIDRLDDGLVTDFFQVGSFPTFNVADSFITVGVGIVLFWEMFMKKLLY